MSSNIQILRICKSCNKEFVARTTVTQCCSELCAKRHYKSKQRAAKIEKSNAETQSIRTLPLERIKAKEYLSVVEAGTLLGISQRTLYRLMAKGDLRFGKFGKRTIIRKADLDKFFINR